MKKKDEIFENLESIQRKINIVRRSILELNKSLNATRKWCSESKEQWDKMSESEKKRLEKLSANIFVDIGKTMGKLTDARLIAYEVAEFMLEE